MRSLRRSCKRGRFDVSLETDTTEAVYETFSPRNLLVDLAFHPKVMKKKRKVWQLERLVPNDKPQRGTTQNPKTNYSSTSQLESLDSANTVIYQHW